VFVIKHSDGYCPWPTPIAHPRCPGWHSRRDVVGELAAAVRGVGLGIGVY
jgi:alpha-L-fucosidase